MSAPDYSPAETMTRAADVVRRVGLAIACAPDPIARALNEHAVTGYSSDDPPISAGPLLGDAAMYARDNCPALVVYYDEGKGRGFMFLEGHPDDAEDSARHNAVEHQCSAWWVVLTDERPEWREVLR
jgi:hypothetical protein